jgi:hypothetical protein
MKLGLGADFTPGKAP